MGISPANRDKAGGDRAGLGTIQPEMITGARLNDLRIVGRVRCILVNM